MHRGHRLPLQLMPRGSDLPPLSTRGILDTPTEEGPQDGESRLTAKETRDGQVVNQKTESEMYRSKHSGGSCR